MTRAPFLALLLLAPALAAAEPRDPREMRFATAAEQTRFDRLRAEIARRAAGFRHIDPSFIGNFIGEKWCGPATSQSACERGAARNESSAGTVYYELETLHYDKDWPKVFGLILSAGELPSGKDALGVRFSLGDGGPDQHIIGTGMQVQWLANVDGAYAPRASLGATISVKVLDHEVQVDAPGGWHAELTRLAKSPEALLATAEARYQALLDEVHTRLDNGKIEGWDVGPYKGGGIPPTRTPRPLTPSEKSAAREQADQAIAAQLAFVRASYRDMYARLRAVVPVDLLLAR